MKIKVTSYNIFHCEDYKREVVDYDAFAKCTFVNDVRLENQKIIELRINTFFRD